MNILIITKEYYPATSADAKRMTGISNYFACAGHNVTIICDTEKAYSDNEGITIIPVKKVGRDSLGMIERLFSHSGFMLQTILKGRKLTNIDVVLATSPPAFSLISGRRLSKILKSKYVVDIRDIWPEVFEQTGVMTKNNLVYKVFDLISKKSYKEADLISVVTPGKKKLLGNKYPEYVKKTHLFTNGFNREILDNPVDKNIQKIFSGNFNVVYTGKIGIAQDLTNLIRIADDFSDKENLVFHLFGSGNGTEEIKKIIDEKQLTNIKFYGYRSEVEVTSALRNAQIAYVSLGSEKLIDSIPTKMYEAMVFGCPILLSAKGDAVDLLEEFSFGLSSLPNDYSTLKENFKYMYKNNEVFKKKQDEVRDGLLKKYARDVMAKDYIEEILKL